MTISTAKNPNSFPITVIRTFAIPNTKEDIYDFFILASSNIEAGGAETDAWLVKLEQTYQKARFLFGTNPDFSYFQELYDKSRRHKGQIAIRAFFAKWWMCLLGVGVAVLGFFLEIMGWFMGEASGNPDSPYYMIAVLALFVIGGGITLFVFGIKKVYSGQKNAKN